MLGVRSSHLLTNLVVGRAADRLYAHAMQRQKRQQAARALQDEQASPPRGRSPSSSPRRNAPDFFQRQQVQQKCALLLCFYQSLQA